MNDGKVSYTVIIPAAGLGRRMQQDVPKQYISILGKTVLEHTLAVFLQHQLISQVVVALDPSDSYWSHLACAQHPKILLAQGGQQRAHSVVNAMQVLKGKLQQSDWVLVHDAARPCVSSDVIDRMVASIGDHPVGGIAAIPIVDTIKKVEAGIGRATLDRSQLWAAQTPQMFRYQLLYDALHSALLSKAHVTDEASAIELLGYDYKIVAGDARNIKLTSPSDLDIVTFFLGGN